MSEEERKREVLWFAMTKLPREVQEGLFTLIEKHDNVDEFISAVMVGECPKCGSEKTRDAEDIKSMDDATVGVCMDCGYVWCLECGEPLDEWPCPHWDEEEEE